jgi:putative oxidoreductase
MVQQSVVHIGTDVEAETLHVDRRRYTMHEITSREALSGLAPGGRGTSRGLHIGLWVAQLVLAVGFALSGLWKATTPIAELAQKLPLAADGHTVLLRFIGASELAGAVGLVLPALTRIRPQLTPLAALGLATVMVLATGYHLSRGELGALPITLGLGALALFVAWGRVRREPIAAR